MSALLQLAHAAGLAPMALSLPQMALEDTDSTGPYYW